MPIQIPLRSSALAFATYDEDTELLEVTFTNGRTYTHQGVPKEIAEGLAEASSAGAYYNTTIKGVYI
jgi:hypothetical protein